MTQQALAQKIANTLLGYAKSQLVLVLVISVVVSVVLSLLHVRFSLLLGIVSGALSVVPTVGMISSAIAAGIVASLDNARFISGVPEIVEGVAVLIIYILINIINDFVLSPFLTSTVVRIHPVILFLSVIIGSSLLGILGAIIAVPMVLVVHTIITHYREERKALEHSGKQ